MKLKIIGIVGLLAITTGCKKNNNPAPPPSDPKISISEVTKPEGNSGTTNFEFQIILDHASTKQVTVQYSTLEGWAKNNEDFTAVTDQVLTFLPNETVKKIIINVITDDLKEGDDDFSVKIKNPVNASITKETAIGRITNDDTKVNFSNTGYDAPTSYTGYSLVWADEFNAASLDASAWNYDIGDGCPNICGWGNNELEYYTSRPDNIFFQDGKMLIEAKKESYNGKQYTSTKIKTEGKKTFKYGRIDIRAKLPKGKGIWPALWMLPQSNVHGGWPRSGEIDIMEMVGHEPNKVYATLHFGPGPGSIQISRNYVLNTGTFFDQFHVFSLEWKQNELKWFIDGNLYSTVSSTDLGANTYPFNEQFFFIINLAVGGNWPGSPDPTTYFPQWLIVDYVRVYQ